MRARAFIRLTRYSDALTVISQTVPTNGDEAAYLRALEATCHALQGSVGMARRTLSAIASDEYLPETRFEIAYARSLLGWVESDPDAMDHALNGVQLINSPELYGQWLYARSWVAALRGQYVEQLKLLEKATIHIVETPEAYDVSLLASATQSMVHLVREIAAPDTFDFAIRTAESMPWTPDLERERFLTFRGLAWAHALRGSHQKALQYSYFARDIAPSVLWVTACYADQAYLARMAGENWSADALLRHAIACAHETDWRSHGEERVAILNLIELVADNDLPTANRLMDVYDAIPVALSPQLALARDQRLRAMEEYARGNILAAAGERVAAIDVLSNAYSIFQSIDYAWRAAATALRLHAITGTSTWLQLASEAVQDFSESSVAEDIRRRAAAAVEPVEASLTPAQHRVFALLCDGLTDKEIARALGISPETVKNHAARVRAAFGVHSRSALIAASHRRAV